MRCYLILQVRSVVTLLLDESVEFRTEVLDLLQQNRAVDEIWRNIQNAARCIL